MFEFERLCVETGFGNLEGGRYVAGRVGSKLLAPVWAIETGTRACVRARVVWRRDTADRSLCGNARDKVLLSASCGTTGRDIENSAAGSSTKIPLLSTKFPGLLRRVDWLLDVISRE